MFWNHWKANEINNIFTILGISPISTEMKNGFINALGVILVFHWHWSLLRIKLSILRVNIGLFRNQLQRRNIVEDWSQWPQKCSIQTSRKLQKFKQWLPWPIRNISLRSIPVRKRSVPHSGPGFLWTKFRCGVYLVLRPWVDIVPYHKTHGMGGSMREMTNHGRGTGLFRPWIATVKSWSPTIIGKVQIMGGVAQCASWK